MTRGRPKKFDENQALRAAMEVFWRRGYEDASCEELLEAMGIKPGSMYCTFGDKKSLFDRAFEMYSQEVFAKGRSILDGPETPLTNVRRLIECWGEAATQPDCKGCLITMTLLEFGKQDEGVAEKARQMLRQLQTSFEEKLRQAQEQGELSESTNVADLAAFLVSTGQGLTVMVRAGAQPTTIQGVVNTTLHMLQPTALGSV